MKTTIINKKYETNVENSNQFLKTTSNGKAFLYTSYELEV